MLVVSKLRNISSLANKFIMGSKFGFENFGSLVQKSPRGEAFFHPTGLLGNSFEFWSMSEEVIQSKKSTQNRASNIRDLQSKAKHAS